MSEQSHEYQQDSSPLVWAMVDGTIGHANQVTGLAVKLGLPYRIKALEYTKTSSVPHKLLGARPMGLTKSCRDALEKDLQRDMPKVVIAAGNRMAAPARWLKKLHPEIKLIQILWPGDPVNEFDMVIAPKHDQVEEHNNVVTTLTALHGLTQETLASEGQRFSMLEEVRELPRPWVSCLIGGNSKHGPYSSADYEEMIHSAKELTGSGSLMISNSRRSAPDLDKKLAQLVGDTPYYFHNAHTTIQNQYLGMLSAADAHVISGESVSMISEAIMSNLPIYIYVPDCLWGKETKINRFHDALLEADVIHILKKGRKFKKWQPKALPDETGRIATLIRRNFSLGG